MAKTCLNFTAAQVLAALRGEVVTVREEVKGFPSIMSSKDILPELRNVYPDIAKNQCPHPIGSTLWVRETWYYDSFSGHRAYKASIPNWEAPRWKSPFTMPRWASRLSVTVKSVAVEQVDARWEWVVEMVKAQP